MEVEIATAVEGDYDSLIQFLNKLEHSDNFYVLGQPRAGIQQRGEASLEFAVEDLFPDHLTCHAEIK